MGRSTEGASLAPGRIRRSFHRRIEPRCGTATPYMTNGKCQGIGCIGRLRHILKLENPAHHDADLFLGGAAGTGDGCLDLARCMQAYRNSMPAATSIATPAACAVPITVCTLCWANTRSMATAVGR